MMEVMEMMLTRLVGDCFAAPPPALLVVDVVDVVDEEVDVDEGVVEVDVGDDDVDEVVAGRPPFSKWFPIMPTDAAAGPVVLIEATEIPVGKAKKSELPLSQQTLDAFRLWSQHHCPP